jgi:hypothetical protein
MRLKPNGKHRTAAGTVAQGLRPGRGSAPFTVERAGVLRIVPCHWRIALLRRRDLFCYRGTVACTSRFLFGMWSSTSFGTLIGSKITIRAPS